MGRPRKKPEHPDSKLLDTPVAEYPLNYIPKIRTLVKAAEVSGAFPPIKRRAPDQTMVGAVVNYINDEGPIHRHYATKPFKKSPLLDPFWKALRVVERTGEEVLASLKWQREFLDDGVFGLAESERSEIVLQELAERDAEVQRMRALLELARSLKASMFLPTYGKKRARWHEAASALIPLIRGAYRAAGCQKIDLRTPNAAGVKALKWALGQLGYHVDEEAIVKFVKRTPKLRDPKYGQFGPFQ